MIVVAAPSWRDVWWAAGVVPRVTVAGALAEGGETAARRAPCVPTGASPPRISATAMALDLGAVGLDFAQVVSGLVLLEMLVE